MLGDDSIVLLIVLICMVVMSAYFSATETAFTSLNRIRLKSRADNGDARAARVLALADKYDQLLSTILIGNNIVNNVATTLSAVLFIDLLGKTSGPAVSTVVLTIVILIFGEVSPKSLAKESPESFALFSAPILRVLLVILRLIPAVPYNLINYTFGLTSMSLGTYLAASAIGIIPGTVVFINIGDKALDPASPGFWLALGLLALLLAGTAWLGRRLFPAGEDNKKGEHKA